MSVELDPPELGFKRPFTQEVSQVLRLHNPNSDPVAFKVKTTAPKQYCVRPNSGRIEPSGQVEVQVLLQAMKEDPPPDAKCRDKFLVQSVAIAANTPESSNVSQVWADVEATSKSSIQERKIRVTFLPPGGESSAAAGGASTNGMTQHDDSPPAYSSPSPSADTPQRATSTTEKSAYEDTVLGTAAGAASGAAAGASGAAAAVSNSVPKSQDDVNAQLEEAKATIARLRAEAAEGLRNRKPQETAKEAVSSVQQSAQQTYQNAPPGGVAVPMVAGLCLLCFLIAYLFF